MELDFKIFTLNCWGIPLIAKDVKDRIEAIGDFLAGCDYDCICLQEVWALSQFESIKSKVSRILPYSHYFFSGSMGSGICMFSKYPIVDVYFHQWAVNGYMHKIHHGDWFGGKGVGLCKIRIKDYLVYIYTAHLHAEYNRENDEYKAHRVIQAFDTAQFIQHTSGGADLVILAGDLNAEPDDLAYNLLTVIPGLTDSFNKFGKTNDKRTTTNESVYNSYTSVKKEDTGKRIDYIMFHPGTNSQVYLKNYDMPLPDRIPDKSFSYSDHEAVAASLHINGDSVNSVEDNTDGEILVLGESIGILEKEMENLYLHRRFYLLCSIISFCLCLVSIFTDVPSSFLILFNILRSLLVIAILFSICMATIWNNIERNGVLSSLLAMKLIVERLNEKKLSKS